MITQRSARFVTVVGLSIVFAFSIPRTLIAVDPPTNDAAALKEKKVAEKQREERAKKVAEKQREEQEKRAAEKREQEGRAAEKREQEKIVAEKRERDKKVAAAKAAAEEKDRRDQFAMIVEVVPRLPGEIRKARNVAFFAGLVALVGAGACVYIALLSKSLDGGLRQLNDKFKRLDSNINALTQETVKIRSEIFRQSYSDNDFAPPPVQHTNAASPSMPPWSAHLQERVSKPDRFSKRSAHSQSVVRVDQSLLDQIASACLDRPHSLDEFKNRWASLGGDDHIAVRSSDQTETPVVIFVGGGDGNYFGIPNTTNWERLSRTTLFTAEGKIAPGSTVEEVVSFAHVEESSSGKRSIKATGVVRLIL